MNTQGGTFHLAGMLLGGADAAAATCAALVEAHPEGDLHATIMPVDGLVGRARELAALTAALDAAISGEGSVLLISGEPGIGKTRLVTELATMAADRNVVVLSGRASRDEGAPTLWPWWQALAGRPERGALPTAAVDPVPVPAGEAHRLRWQAFETVVAGLVSAAATGGLVVAMEDLHWADVSSLELLTHCAGRPALLLVATYRSIELSVPLLTAITELHHRGGTREVNLRAWTADEVAEAVGERAHPSWVPVLHRASAGIPLFVRELLAALDDAGVTSDFAPADGRWPLGVPAHLAAITVERLTRLPNATGTAVSVCCLMGIDVAAGDVAFLGALDPVVAHAALEEGAAAGLLTVTRAVPLRVGTPHVLVRDSIYQAIPAGTRLAWHRRAADGIESGRLGGDAVTHRLRSVVDDESRQLAVRACRRAAASARDGLGFDRAVAVLDAALALTGLSNELRCELLLDAADAEYQAGSANAAIERCQQVAVLTERPDLMVRAALVVRGIGGTINAALVPLCDRALAVLPGDAAASRAKVLAQRAMAMAELVGTDEIDTISGEVLPLAERSGDPQALADALRARQHALSGPAGVTERLALAARMLQLAGPGVTPEAELWGLLWRIDAAFQLGDVGALSEDLARIGLLADRLGWPLAQWHTHRLRAARALFVGDFSATEAHLGRARQAAGQTREDAHQTLLDLVEFEKCTLLGRVADVAERARDFATAFGPMPIAWANGGCVLLSAGQPDAAREHYERIRPLLPHSPTDGRWFFTVLRTAELALAFGEQEIVQWCYRRVVPYAAYYQASGGGTFVCRGSVSRPLGQMAAALGDVSGAERHLTDAVAMDHRVGAVPYLALSQLELASVLTARGSPDDLSRAAGLANQAASTARRLGMAPAVARADELLTVIRRAKVVAFTGREREVLTLLARGASNRAMAAKLVLSERTIEFHVANLLAKIGAANRTEAATWALRHGFGTTQ